MTLIADVFPKSRTPKNMVRSMPKKSRFRASVEKQRDKRAQTLFKFEVQLLYHIFQSLKRQLSYKKSLLQKCKITKLFPNTMSADGKCSLLDRDNLMQRSQMLLYRNQKAFSECFSSILKYSLNLEHLQRKYDAHS